MDDDWNLCRFFWATLNLISVTQFNMRKRNEFPTFFFVDRELSRRILIEYRQHESHSSMEKFIIVHRR